MKHILLKVILLFAINTSVHAQYSTKPINDKLKSLEVSRAGIQLSTPIMYLNNLDAGIVIEFDILNAEMNEVTYSVIHCNTDWMPSDLSVNEYIEGFQSSYIDNYEYSQATNIDYVHYKLNLPNDDVQMKLSGNYAVVARNEDSGDTLFTACFYIIDQQVSINGSIGGASNIGISGKSQQVNFNISHSGYPIARPITETKVIVQQNNSRIHQATGNTPTYIRNDELVYEQHPKFSFPGGGEFRTFECVSKRYAGKGVENISYFSPFHHFTLKSEELKGVRNYEYDNDINGKFVIRRQESEDEDSDYEAEYVVAHFSIPMKDPILDGKVYISGGFTYDELSKKTQMIYNNDRQMYEGLLQIKQGYYDYRYYIQSTWDKEIRSAPIEMDAFQTENDYQIFFYHRQMGERYDRLIGYKTINSIKN